MAIVSGGELVMRTLLRAGVGQVYLLYGGHLQPICESIRAHGVPFVDMRHEATAGYAAQGYARASGGFGVAMVSAAPGFTNVLTSVTNAYIDRTPVLYISTSAAMADAETNNFMSGFDPVAMVRPVTKWAHCATRTCDIPRLLAHAIRVMTTAPAGPVLLDLPWDVVFGEVDEDLVEIPQILPPVGGPLPRADAVEDALRLLAQAQRPVIMAGEGASQPGVAQELRAFAAATGIPVFSDYDGFGLLPSDDPLFGGSLRKLSEFRAADNSPDVVLALGVRFGFMTVGANGLVPAAAKLIHVDVDPVEIGRIRKVDVGMAAGSREALQALNGARGAYRWPDWHGWQRKLQEARSARGLRESQAAAGRSVPIPPYSAALAIVECAGEEACIVVDGADAHMWIGEVARSKKPGRFFSHSGFFGCLGYGVGFAMGVQNVHPDRRVVCVIGDGAFGLTLAELHTLARHRLPIVVVVMNNRAWGATTHYQQTTSFGRSGEFFATDLAGAEYHTVAAGLGCHAELVTRIEQLKPAMAAAFASGRPACINVEIDVTDVPPDHKALRFLHS